MHRCQPTDAASLHSAGAHGWRRHEELSSAEPTQDGETTSLLGLWLILVWLLLCFYELDKGTEAKLGCVCVPAATDFQIPVSVCLMQADGSETKWKQGQKLQFISNWGGNSKILSCHSRLLCQLDYKLLGFLSSIPALFSVYWDGTWRAEVIIRIHSTKSSAGVHWHHTERHKFIPVEELSLIYLIYLGLWLAV